MSSFLHFLSEFALLFLVATFLENTVLARGFGLSRAIAMALRPRSVFVYGGLLTALTLVAGLACYGVHALFPDLPAMVSPLVYLSVTTGLYLLLYWLLTRKDGVLQDNVRHYLPVATFNCAVMGSIFLSISNAYSIGQFIAFGLGNGAGFLLATLLLLNADRALSEKEAPKAFSGFPLMLIYVGILSMVFYSLVGHRLPF